MAIQVFDRAVDLGGFRAMNAADAVAASDLATFRQIVTWAEPTDGDFALSTVAPGVTTVPVRIEVKRRLNSGESAPTTWGLELAHPALDMRSATNPPTGDVAVGVLLGVDGLDRATEGWTMFVDDGMVSQTPYSTGPWSRGMPMVIQPGSPINYRSTGHPIDRMCMVWFPNSALNSDGGTGSPVHIGIAATVLFKGAPDNEDGSVIMARRINVGVLNQELYVGDMISLGQNASSEGYLDWGGGGEPPVGPAGQLRFKLNTTTMALDVSVNAGAYRPLSSGFLFPAVTDPGARTYPAGETILRTVVPSDSGVAGMSWMKPYRWRMPPAIDLGGGNFLTTTVRLQLATGSQSAPLTNTNTLHSKEVKIGVSTGITGTRIISAQFIVNNTGGSTSSSQDIGQFEFEGEVG